MFAKPTNRFRNLPSNSHNESNLWLTFNKEVTLSLSGSLSINKSLIVFSVFLKVFFGIGLGSSSGSFSVFLILCSFNLDGIGKFFISSLLFKNVFWNNSLSILFEKY